MSGESWLAMKDSSTHQSWISIKARHSVFFIFSVIYILYVFLPFMFYFSSGVVGGWGCLVRAAPATFFIVDSVLTFLLFGGLCPLQASVHKFVLEGRPLWSPFLTLFNTIFNLQTF